MIECDVIIKNFYIRIIGNGIINGTSATTLSPQSGATRAQVATMMTRFVRNVVAGAIVQELT